MRPATKQPRGKIPIWTLPNILSLLIGIVGTAGIVELRPQMAVVPQCEPLKKGQPFSIPFKISNTGYFSFDVSSVHCYFAKMEGKAIDQNLVVHLERATLHDKAWDHRRLERAEGQTLMCEVQ